MIKSTKYKTILLIITIPVIFSCNTEKKFFEKTISKNTPKAYSKFLTKYPNSNLNDSIKNLRQKSDNIEIIISTFLGNKTRNFYGNSLPNSLDTIWKFYLGEGLSPAYGYNKIWKGAGWTGQPLLIKEKGKIYIIQGAFDYGLHKIDAQTGKEIWKYKFDDIIKGTGTIWINKNAPDIKNRYIIIQGSRKGWNKNHESPECWSLRAISYTTGTELWRYNSLPTKSYSRDVDASPLTINDTAYIGLENGLFTIFDPDHKHGNTYKNYTTPKIIKQIKYFNDNDIKTHATDLVIEASPTFLNNHIYTPSGTGWIYGYNLQTKEKDWELYIGADLNGSMPVTDDKCLLVPIEKQYIKGKGGLMKINPAKTPQKAIEWFMPTDNIKWIHWQGGIIGSVTINDATKKPNDPFIATFVDCKGELYIIDYKNISKNKKTPGPNLKKIYPRPKLLAKIKINATISTPIIVQNKIFAATDKGLFLFKFKQNKENFEIKLIDSIPNITCDATPITWNNKIFIADYNGYLWCLGDKK